MRDQSTDVDTIELSPTPRTSSKAPSSYAGYERAETAGDGLLPRYKSSVEDTQASDDNPPPEKRWPSWMAFRDVTELFYFLAVLATAIPTILLVRYSPTLSTKLGSSACLANGEFLLPGTASIWNPAYFFTISITMQGANSGWTYTQVKIIDLVWDVLMGRAGQLLLIYIAYRVFSRSLDFVMETKAVSYQTYSAVSFESTSMRSIWQYLYNMGWHDTKQTWRCWHTFLAMTLASLYVVSMPTLFSAMTGYAAIFTPSVEMPPAEFAESRYSCENNGGCTVYPCGGGENGDLAQGEGLVPGWGVVIDSMRVNYGAPWTISLLDVDGSSKGDAYYLREYYERYKAAYSALATDPTCENISSLADCPATNIWSAFEEPGLVLNLEPPLLKIQLWENNTDGMPNVWLCQSLILNTHDFNNGNVTGICNAAPNQFTGTSYQWGFSFLLLLLVCVLNLFFAAIMYGLWMEARRNSLTPIRREKKVHPGGHVEWRTVDDPSTIKSVMRIAAQARSDHGNEVFQWTSKRLNKQVWRGKKGIRERKNVVDVDAVGD